MECLIYSSENKSTRVLCIRMNEMILMQKESDRLHTVPFIKNVYRNTYKTSQTCYLVMHKFFEGFPDSSVGKESACNAGDLGLIPGFGRSTGEGIGYPLQYSWASLVAQLVKNPSACNAGDLGLTPGLRRSPREGKGYPVQYSGLEDSMECTVHGVPKSQT